MSIHNTFSQDRLEDATTSSGYGGFKKLSHQKGDIFDFMLDDESNSEEVEKSRRTGKCQTARINHEENTSISIMNTINETWK